MNYFKLKHPSRDVELRWFLFVLTLILLGRQLWWTLFGYLNVDEFENLQVIWLFEHGIFPYRDYYHPHLPVYNLLLYPLYRIFGAGAELPGMVRLTFFPLVLFTIWQVGWIGHRISGIRMGGYLAVIFLLSSPMIGKTIAEVRPDSFALTLSLGVVMLFLGYLRCPTPFSLYGAGAVLGLTILFNRKVLFLMLVLTVLAEQYHRRVLKLSLTARLKRSLVFMVTALSPFTIVIGLLSIAGLLSWERLVFIVRNVAFMPVTDLFAHYKAETLKTLFRSAPVVFLVALTSLSSLGSKSGGPSVRNLSLLLISLYLMIETLEVLICPIVAVHMFVLPFMLLCVLCTWQLGRASFALRPIAVLLAVCAGSSLSDGFYYSRTYQTRVFDYVLKTVSQRVPVLDFQTGLGAFRPLMGRYIYYFPEVLDRQASESQTAVVTRGLIEKKYGAVISVPPGKTNLAPKSVQELIKTNYHSADFPEVLLPYP